jgi:hypothetical protein
MGQQLPDSNVDCQPRIGGLLAGLGQSPQPQPPWADPFRTVGFLIFPENYSNQIHLGFKPSKSYRSSNEFDKYMNPLLKFDFKHNL